MGWVGWGHLIRLTPFIFFYIIFFVFFAKLCAVEAVFGLEDAPENSLESAILRIELDRPPQAQLCTVEVAFGYEDATDFI